MPKNVSTIDIDDRSAEQIEKDYEETIAAIEAIQQRWGGLMRMSEKERATSSGRALATLAGPLRSLFSILVRGTDETKALGAAFNALGEEDYGDDPSTFEADLLLRRLDRAEREAKIAERLGELQRHFADDVLHTGELVVGPGMKGLDLARTLGRSNAGFRALLAPVLDALRDMTKRARASKKSAPEQPK